MQTLPATDNQLQVVREAQDSDVTCTQIKSYCQHGWPHQTRLPVALKKYLPVKDELSVTNGLLLRGNRLVIPHPLQPEMLQKLHAGATKESLSAASERYNRYGGRLLVKILKRL